MEKTGNVEAGKTPCDICGSTATEVLDGHARCGLHSAANMAKEATKHSCVCGACTPHSDEYVNLKSLHQSLE